MNEIGPIELMNNLRKIMGKAIIRKVFTYPDVFIVVAECDTFCVSWRCQNAKDLLKDFSVNNVKELVGRECNTRKHNKKCVYISAA